MADVFVEDYMHSSTTFLIGWFQSKGYSLLYFSNVSLLSGKVKAYIFEMKRKHRHVLSKDAFSAHTLSLNHSTVIFSTLNHYADIL